VHDSELYVSSRDLSNHRFRAYALSVAVRDLHAFLDNGRNTVLQLGIYALFQFVCAWIIFFRPR
jgi:hypothetical protein